MKIVLAALASASLVAAGLAASPALAQSRGGGHHGGGGAWHGGGGGGSAWHGGGGYHGGGHYTARGGGYRGGAYYGGRGYYGHGYGGYYGGRYAYGFPYFAGGAALGFALGSSYLSPWYYDYPPAYSYSYRVDPGPPLYEATPDYGAEPPVACGSWTWDTGRQTYFWTPCSTPAGPPPDGYDAPGPPPGS
jgi:hypothetical protein